MYTAPIVTPIIINHDEPTAQEEYLKFLCSSDGATQMQTLSQEDTEFVNHYCEQQSTTGAFMLGLVVVAVLCCVWLSNKY